MLKAKALLMKDWDWRELCTGYAQVLMPSSAAISKAYLRRCSGQPSPETEALPEIL
jgi:hypothetical protein